MIKLEVRCPFCGWKQETSSVKRVRCQRCGRSYEVYLLDSRGRVRGTRIVRLISGSLQELHKLAYKEKIKRGRYAEESLSRFV